MIYKLLTTAEWRAAAAGGSYAGSDFDRQDGFIHFSAGDQVVQTAVLHFSGQRGLTLLAVDDGKLGDALKWEASRGGALFPHLYAPLPASAVVAAMEIPEDVPIDDAIVSLLGTVG